MSIAAGNVRMRLASRNDHIQHESDMLRLFAVQWPIHISNFGDDLGSGAKYVELLFETRADAEAFQAQLKEDFNIYPQIIQRPYLKPELMRPRAA